MYWTCICCEMDGVLYNSAGQILTHESEPQPVSLEGTERVRLTIHALDKK